jgi:CubicO group peptidase (beta-lactamase class C family)
MRDGAFGAMGGVQTSARDYARWVAFLLSAWPARDGPETGPVRRSTVRELAQGLNFVAVTRRPGQPDSCPQATAYGMGFRIAQDCDLGLTLAHGGGYPGYGSYLLLLPEYGVGLFAFANRTYAGPSPAVWQAAAALHRAGLLTARTQPVSQALASRYDVARRIWETGGIAGYQPELAMNFLMDRSIENWARELARLRGVTGVCRTDGPIIPTGLLSGMFSWACEHGRLTGQLLLAPTNPPTIQALRFNVVP